MKAILKNINVVSMLTAAGMVLLGIMLIVSPIKAVLAVCMIAGAILLASGVFLVVLFVMNRNRNGINALDIILCILGAALTAVGLFILIRPQAVIAFVVFLFAIILFLRAIGSMRELRQLKNANDSKWMICVVAIVVTLVMAVITVWNPIRVIEIAYRIFGVFMIFSGISGFLLELRVMHYEKENRDNRRYIEGEVIDVDPSDLRYTSKSEQGRQG